VKQTIHLNVLLTLRTSAEIPPLPLLFFMPSIFYPLPPSFITTSTTAAAAPASRRVQHAAGRWENYGWQEICRYTGRVPEEDVSVPALLLLRSNRQAVSSQSPPLRTHQTACDSAVQVAMNSAATVWATAGASRFPGCWLRNVLRRI